jgi:hypothetical protein
MEFTAPPPPLRGPLGRQRLLEAFERFAAPLADYAAEVTEGPSMASADSIAMVELSHDRSFATDQWLRPVQNAFSYGTVLTVFLADHLASLAASCTAPRIGPSFSFLTTIRPIVESAPVAHWLLDPHTTVMHRVQRGLAYRWDSAVNLKRNSHLVEATTNADREMTEIRQYAETRGWTTKGASINGGLIIGDQELPHPETAFGPLIERKDASARTLWNYLSANGHGSFYALTQGFALVPEKTNPFDSDNATLGVTVDSARVMRYGLLAFLAVDAVVRARDELMGWERKPAMTHAADALVQLHNSLTQIAN